MRAPSQRPLLEVDGLHLSIDSFDGRLKVLEAINVSIAVGEAVGVVGETGCGKSVLARTIMRLLPSPPARIDAGEIRLEGRRIDRGDDIAGLRGRDVAMVFQDPMTYLNPLFTIGTQLHDVIKAKHAHLPRSERPTGSGLRERALELLAQVGLPNPARQLRQYPHQLSGGMRQRVLIAMALSTRPKLLIADEPTTALDVTTQAQILELIAALVDDHQMALMLISHDLGVVASACSRIVVMYAGTIAEDAPRKRLFAEPLHPYTQGLLRAIPHLDGARNALAGIAGSIPSLIDPPGGCRFHPRCPHAGARCRRERPQPTEVRVGHRVSCHLVAGGVQ